MVKFHIFLMGYDKLGVEGNDGIRYAWRDINNQSYYVESAAFPHHRKGLSDYISGYTTSVSLGCVLKPMGYSCKFCRTGKVIPFSDLLTACDIAKENVLMTLIDMQCSKNQTIHATQREFAYMGQGEPGYSYQQIRMAIKITNNVMKILNQKVYRHIISTSGIPELVEAYKEDLLRNYYDSRVTFHFSLHLVTDREKIMPIENKYSYQDVLKSMEAISAISGEKPCVGIMLFKNYKPDMNLYSYSNDICNLSEIVKNIKPEKFRLSLCEFNDSEETGKADVYGKLEADEALHYVQSKGYEAKLFSSYGREKATACGMLGSKKPEFDKVPKWEALERKSELLINEALNNISL